MNELREKIVNFALTKIYIMLNLLTKKYMVYKKKKMFYF